MTSKNRYIFARINNPNAPGCSVIPRLDRGIHIIYTEYSYTFSSYFKIMTKAFYTYILASKCRGTLYIGVTSNLVQRIWQHKNHFAKGFTAKYEVTKLVYYEEHSSATAAIQREKRLKEWQRQWKIELINKFNPAWEDLYEKII